MNALNHDLASAKPWRPATLVAKFYSGRFSVSSGIIGALDPPEKLLGSEFTFLRGIDRLCEGSQAAD